MQRVLLRISALAAVVVFGVIAIAQAQRGLNSDKTADEVKDRANAALPLDEGAPSGVDGQRTEPPSGAPSDPFGGSRTSTIAAPDASMFRGTANSSDTGARYETTAGDGASGDGRVAQPGNPLRTVNYDDPRDVQPTHDGASYDSASYDEGSFDGASYDTAATDSGEYRSEPSPRFASPAEDIAEALDNAQGAVDDGAMRTAAYDRSSDVRAQAAVADRYSEDYRETAPVAAPPAVAPMESPQYGGYQDDPGQALPPTQPAYPARGELPAASQYQRPTSAVEAAPLHDTQAPADYAQDPRQVDARTASRGMGQLPPTAGVGGRGGLTTSANDASHREGTGRPGDPKLDGPQAPTVWIRKVAPEEIQVGKPATFSIVVRNAGNVAAHAVEVRDVIPEGTRYLDSSPTADVGANGDLVWQLGTLGPDDEVTVELQLMPTDEGEIGSVASVHFRADCSARTIATRPQLAVEVQTTNRVLIGDEVEMSIRVTKTG